MVVQWHCQSNIIKLGNLRKQSYIETTWGYKWVQLYKNIQYIINPTNMKIINLFLLAICLTIVTAEDQGDWVDPWKLPIQFTVRPFYAGYLSVSNDRQYYYVYHPSQSNPSKDPLVVRVPTGPACSPLYSWLYSKGPFIFNPQKDTFRINPHNWNKQANVLFIQGPGGVGFATDKTGVKRNITDAQFSLEMIQALYSFYSKFPELKDQDLYLTGEQYAGITVPYMAKIIVEKNNDRETPVWQKIKLRGFMLENPCTMGDQCDSHFEFTSYTMEYLKNHYFISKQRHTEYQHACTTQPTSQHCLDFKHRIQAAFTNTGADITNIYRECVKQTGPEKYKCMDTAGILALMNSKTFREDIHADPSVEKWDLCNLDIMQSYKRDPLGSLHVYEQLLREERDLRIWIVSGTLSASVPTVGTRRWVESLKLTLRRPTIRVWDAWKYDHNINAGGLEEIRGFTFLTVRAAGSKIYRDQPQIGYHIYDSFIKGKAL